MSYNAKQIKPRITFKRSSSACNIYKHRGGMITIAVSALFSAHPALAAQCGSLTGWAGGTCEIYENTAYTTPIGWDNAITANGGAVKTVVKSPTDNTLGDFIVNSSTSSKYSSYGSGGFAANGASLTANRLAVTLRPESDKHVQVYGATATNAGTITADTLDIDVVYARENTTDRGPISSYGVQVGTAIINGDRAAGSTSKITVRDADIKITNTAGTQTDYLLWGFIPTQLGVYQLTGIRVIRNEDNGGSNAIFESTGKVTINAYDSSTAGTGDYVTGVYVSGEDNRVILNDSEITIGKSGQYSSALKIGKSREVGTGGGEVISKGHMALDTTAESTAPTIRMVGTGSALIADTDTSSSVIKSANTAVLFGTGDYVSTFKSTDQQVALRNAKINTTSADASLILVNSGVTGARMTLSGSDSDATAAADGWLAEVEDPSAWSGNQAALSFILTDSALAKGLMTVSGTSTLDAEVSNHAVWQLQKKSSLTEQRSTLTSLNLVNGGTLDAGTNPAEAYYVSVPELNSYGGIISLHNDSYSDVLVIEGNYTGNNGATVKMNTLWNAPGGTNGEGSQSDALKITGTASGSTRVIPVQTDGTENVIDGSIQQVASVLNTVPVVYVGTSGTTAFTGTAQTTGAAEVQLAKRTTGDGDEYYWTMSAADPTKPVNPEKPVNPPKPIYYNAVPSYVAMPRANLEQGYATIGTLHERRSENMISDLNAGQSSTAKGQTWGRIYGKSIKQNGKDRLNLDTGIYGLQIGHDFFIRENANGGRNLTGGYLSYSKADTDFADEYRSLNGLVVADKDTGKGKSDAVSLGITNTYYSANGTYLDTVGQISYLHNKYEPRNHDTARGQNGWGLALSVEAGRPFALSQSPENHWSAEPQAQLIYQYVQLGGFNDSARHIDQNGQSGLRGRVGVRLVRNAPTDNNQTNTFYAVANVWHDFLSPSGVDIGRDRLREKYAPTWGEIGAGVQFPVAKNSYLYGDARFEHGFGGAKRTGLRGNLGFKYTWK